MVTGEEERAGADGVGEADEDEGEDEGEGEELSASFRALSAEVAME